MAASALTQTAQPPIPVNDRLGIAFISSAELKDVSSARYQQATSAGIRWNRWPIYWGDVVKNGGYTPQDTNLIRDRQHGLQVNAILLQTPDQYATAGRDIVAARVGEGARDDDRLAYASPELAPLATSAPRNLYVPPFLPDGRVNPDNYWAQFVYTTVQRYKPGGDLARNQNWTDGYGIRHWELWNEADSPSFWNGSVKDYYQLLKVGYLAVKAADPQAKVLLGGLAYWSNKSWFPALLDEMARDPDLGARQANNAYFDILPLHWYSQPTLLYDKTIEFRKLLVERGFGERPIWINETSVPAYGESPGHPICAGYSHSANAEEQAAFVIQAVAYGLAAGAERIFLFQHYDDGNGEAYGLHRNTGDPRPAYNALQLASTYFRDAKSVVRETTGSVEKIQFWGTSLNGQLARVTATWSNDPASRVTWLSALGQQATVIQRKAQPQTLGRSGERYILAVPRATALDECADPKSGYIIGGEPALVIEPLAPDTSAPQTTLRPLRDSTCDIAIVGWSAQEAGWGIRNYDVQVRDLSDKNAPWKDWYPATRETSHAFGGAPGHQYAFRARARDYAGNVEPFSDDQARWAKTTINGCPPRVPTTGLIRNGHFEESELPGGWSMSGSTEPRLVADAHSGARALALGRDFVGQAEPPMNGGGNSTITQQFNVPGNAPRPFLGYWYALENTAPAPATGSDWHSWASRLEVIITDQNGIPNYVDLLWEPKSWTYRTIDLSAWRGQRVTLTYNVWQSSAAFTTVARIDDIVGWGDRNSVGWLGR